MVSVAPALPSDRQLFDAVSRGSDAAWQELLARHAAAIRALVRGRRHKRAFDRGLGGLRDRLLDVPADVVGSPRWRAFRPRVLASVGGVGIDVDDDLDRAGAVDPRDGASALATAYARLPEDWQSVLWFRSVDRLDDDRIAPLVGRPSAEVADLAENARRGLADAFLLECEHVIPAGVDVEPLAAVIDEHLAAVVVGRLVGHGAARRRPVCSDR